MKAMDKVYLGFVLTVVVVVLALAIQGRSDCSKSGGTYVRSLFWFECVEGRTPK